MIDMDYEKKYNEAIERMRKMLGPWRELAYNGKSFLQDLESIFPELAESEDERIRKELIHYFESLSDCLATEERHAENRRWLSFLKSLRPSWKPSEEQMEALEYVIRDYREDSCNATANYLQEILDHLKNM